MKFLEAKGLPKDTKSEHKMQPGVREDQRGMLRGNRSDVTEGNVSGITSDSDKRGKNTRESKDTPKAPASGVTEEK